jgi:hypothetical protein
MYVFRIVFPNKKVFGGLIENGKVTAIHKNHQNLLGTPAKELMHISMFQWDAKFEQWKP